MSARPASGVGRTALLLVPVALLCRGAAFLVPMVVALWFGVGPVTDAWFWALSFPTFSLVLASTALGTAALPALAGAVAEGPARVERLLGGLVAWGGLVSLGFGLLVAAAANGNLARITDFDPSTRALAGELLWLLVPFMALTGLGVVLRVGCEVQGHFRAVAFTPLLRASTVIGVTWLALDGLGPRALPLGLAAGEITQIAWWSFLLRRSGVALRPGLRLDPAVRRVAADLAPILGGEVLVALNVVIDKGFAAWLPSGSVATLEYADRARVIPQTVLESSLLMVSFATWANLRASGRLEEARRQMDQALRWTLALAAPVLAGMYIGRVALVRLLYERGAFHAEDTLAAAGALGWYVPGLLFNMMGILAVRAHVVERNLGLIFGLGVLSVTLNTTLNALLMGPMGINGLALATTLNHMVIPGLYLVGLRRQLAPDRRRWAIAGGVAIAALGVAAAFELLWGPPASILDLRLWAAALPCLALLGLGWRGTRPPRDAPAAAR